MILKTGDQGPSWTARKPHLIMERLAADPYLARVYPVVGAWDLPDGSTATLRARRVDAEADLPSARLGRIAEEAVRRRLAEVARDVEGLEVRVTHDDSIRRGHLERVEVSARAATVGELTRPRTPTLRVHDLTLIFDDVLINPWSLAAEGRLDPLDARAIRLPRARILAANLTAFLRQEKGFRRAALVLEPGAIAFRFSQLGPDVSGIARILPASTRPFELAFDRVRVAGLPVPGGLVNWVVRGYDPSLRLASRLPVPVTIGRVEVGADAVKIVPNP
jgi:hypothetical protein